MSLTSSMQHSIYNSLHLTMERFNTGSICYCFKTCHMPYEHKGVYVALSVRYLRSFATTLVAPNNKLLIDENIKLYNFPISHKLADKFHLLINSMFLGLSLLSKKVDSHIVVLNGNYSDILWREMLETRQIRSNWNIGQYCNESFIHSVCWGENTNVNC